MLIKIKQDNMKPLKQMNFDPLTGAPIITPGPEQNVGSRSSQLYAGSETGYPQGSMETAMKSNPMIANLASQGLMQNDPQETFKEKTGHENLWDQEMSIATGGSDWKGHKKGHSVEQGKEHYSSIVEENKN